MSLRGTDVSKPALSNQSGETTHTLDRIVRLRLAGSPTVRSISTPCCEEGRTEHGYASVTTGVDREIGVVSLAEALGSPGELHGVGPTALA